MGFQARWDRFHLGWRRKTAATGGVLLVVAGAIWKAADVADTLAAVVAVAVGLWSWLTVNGGTALMVAGIVLVLVAVLPLSPSRIARFLDRLWLRWRMRGWTSTGLSWRLLRDSHRSTPDGHSLATLSITPIPGAELPQPLDIAIRCAGLIASITTRFYEDAAKPEGESSGDVEIPPPPAGKSKVATFRLLAPKLLPPARLDVIVELAGNAGIRVEEVKHAPVSRGWRPG